MPQDKVQTIQERLNGGSALAALALDRTRTHTLDKGSLTALDNQVDVQTGTVRAKARYTNDKMALFPSQFVNVRLELGNITGAVLVPVTALRHSNNGDFVYVLKADKTVTVRMVTRGQATTDMVEIRAGLEAGEQVITEGADRLKEGAKVTLAGDKPAMGAPVARGQATANAATAASTLTARPAHRRSGCRIGASHRASEGRSAMSPSTPFIKRPVATALLMLAIVLAGLVGFKFLPLAALPQVDFPTIQVQTLYPGASPEVMGQTVTAPLERQFGQMSGLQRMSSTSAAGVSIITLQFTLGQTLDVAEQEVQAAINAGGSLLPTDLPAPPVYAKINPADAPVLTLAITSDTMPLTQVQNIVNTRLALKISQVNGVGLVSLSGGQRPAVRIQGDTKLLASYGLGLDSLRTAIAAANVNSAKGSFDGPTRSFTINANDQLVTAEDYKRLIITYKNGAPVRLSDVANVVDSAENTRLGAWSGKQPAIILNVQRQPGANVIKTVDAIKALLPDLQASLPAAMKLDVLSDRTTGIRASVEHVEMELLLSVLLVVLVIFAFLHSMRATVIASLSVPISLIGACGVMYLLGYSLNNLSLMALDDRHRLRRR